MSTDALTTAVIDVAAVAGELDRARRTATPIPPLSERCPGLAVADAYRIQLAGVELRTAGGAVTRGHKVGLTSYAMQRQLGVQQPDYGALLDDMILPDGAVLPSGELINPRIEPEIAFLLGDDLAGPGVTVAHARAAVQLVVPALEVIDSRIRDWRITLPDTIADNASSGLVVLGVQPLPLYGRSLRLTGCVLRRNGEIVGTGAGGAVLGDPLAALAWLANTLATWGRGLSAGDLVLPGACTAAVPAAPGDVFTATFAGLGCVTARVADRASESGRY